MSPFFSPRGVLEAVAAAGRSCLLISPAMESELLQLNQGSPCVLRGPRATTVPSVTPRAPVPFAAWEIRMVQPLKCSFFMKFKFFQNNFCSVSGTQELHSGIPFG